MLREAIPIRGSGSPTQSRRAPPERARVVLASSNCTQGV